MKTLSREAFMLESVERSRYILANIATRYKVDLNDLLQDAAITAALCYEAAQRADCPEAYSKAAIRRCALIKIAQAYRASASITLISLDAPLATDAATTLADVLPSPVDRTQDDDAASNRTRDTALYAALARLCSDEQEYAHELFGVDFEPPANSDGTPRQRRSRNAVRKALYRHLRTDQELACVVSRV